MHWIDDQKAIQAFLPHRTDPPLVHGIRIRSAMRGQDGLDACRCKHCLKRTSELGIPIMYEDPNGQLSVLKLPEHLSGLLGHPCCVGPLGAASHVHPSAVQLDEKQDVHSLQKDSLDGEKVTGQHLRAIVVEERTPI